MDRGVVGGSGGAVGYGGGDGAFVDATGVRQGRKAGFEGKGVGCEPVEEGGSAKDAGVGQLRGVGVGI